MRILHFSDIHLDIRLQSIPRREWLGKRIIAGLNQYFFRRKVFHGVAGKVAQLCVFRREQGVDLVVSTGDFTLLGTEAEYRAVREALAPMYEAPRGFIAVPGNHDLYLRDTVRERRFERYFGDAMRTDRDDLQVDGSWPAVRLFGDDLAIVSVNSARPNATPWRSSGRIPRRQLEGLEAVLADPDIASRFVFIMTHYAPVLADGEPDRWSHGLVNAAELLRICAPIKRGAILCGHVHRCFRVRVPGVGPEIFCAGSATINERAGCWLFDVDGEQFSARRGRWIGERFVVTDDSTTAASDPQEPADMAG
jgi:3',5'-cyclic AMP phosphodiesterase CpdA